MTTFYRFPYALLLIIGVASAEENPLQENHRQKREEAFVEMLSEVTLCLLYTSPSPRDQRGSRMPACG